jgi:hypothetical protein
MERNWSSLLIKAIVASTMFLLTVELLAATTYRIKLKNGKVITTSNYYEKNGCIYIQKYGGYMGIDRSEVEEVSSDESPAAISRQETAAVSKNGAHESNAALSNSDSRNSRQTPAKSGDPVAKEDKERAHKIASLESQLKNARTRAALNCGQAEEIRENMPPAPPTPKGVSRVSEKTAKQFQKHVEDKVREAKASSSCDYHTKRVAELEEELKAIKR